jgi:hypothetical protein
VLENGSDATEQGGRLIGGVESVSHRARSSSGRYAFCPLCGEEQPDRLARETRSAEDALCANRCADAWQALTALRGRESESSALAQRRRLEWQSGQQHGPLLSELLLERWRAGDWSVAPEDLLRRLQASAPSR